MPSGCPSGERLQEQELVVSWEDSRPLAGVPEAVQWKGVFRWLQAWTLAGVGLGPQRSEPEAPLAARTFSLLGGYRFVAAHAQFTSCSILDNPIPAQP